MKNTLPDTLTAGYCLDRLKNDLFKIVALEDFEWDLISRSVQYVQLKKGEFFVREGNICTQLGFLCDGILRIYYHIDGKEITSYFNFRTRNPIVSAFESFLGQKPSNENIHALEDCFLITITYSELQQLYRQSANIQKLGRIMAEQNYLLAIQRIRSLQFQSALERYEQLLVTYPLLINKIPHHYIASYLGITPESLSRIRKI